jgi:hypothetical protein
MSIHNAVRAFAVAFIIAVCAFGQFGNTFTTTSSSSFPPVGIAGTESVQVIVSNTATVSSTTPAAATAAAPSCTGSVAFYNANGAIIGAAMPFTVTSGQIYQVSLPYASAASTSVREMIRAVVSLTTTFPGAAPCSLSYSLATFDTATGVTHAIVAGTGISGTASPLAGHL